MFDSDSKRVIRKSKSSQVGNESGRNIPLKSLNQRDQDLWMNAL